MTPERERELECTDCSLTWEEWKEGYHFCEEFDGLVTQGELFSDDDEFVCICGFDRRKVWEYTAEKSQRLVDKLTVSVIERALKEIEGK